MVVSPGRIEHFMEKAREACENASVSQDYVGCQGDADPTLSYAVGAIIAGMTIFFFYRNSRKMAKGIGYDKYMQDFRRERSEWEDNHPAYKKKSFWGKFWK